MADILLKGKDGVSTTYEGVEELRVPIDSTTKQSYFTVPSLYVCWLKKDGTSDYYECLACTRQSSIAAVIGEYGVNIPMTTGILEQNGYMIEEGKYSLLIAITNKELTIGKRYTMKYITDTR